MRSGIHVGLTCVKLDTFGGRQGGDSLEKVILFYVDLAEKKVAEASERAKAVNLAAAAAKISDLENDVVRFGVRVWWSGWLSVAELGDGSRGWARACEARGMR